MQGNGQVLSPTAFSVTELLHSMQNLTAETCMHPDEDFTAISRSCAACCTHHCLPQSKTHLLLHGAIWYSSGKHITLSLTVRCAGGSGAKEDTYCIQYVYVDTCPQVGVVILSIQRQGALVCDVKIPDSAGLCVQRGSLRYHWSGAGCAVG